jgi:hypothetical protein
MWVCGSIPIAGVHPVKGNNILDSGDRQAIYGGHDDTSLIPYWINRGDASMHVPNTARRSVFFVGDLTDRGVFRPRGTAFLVGIPSSRAARYFSYIVTAAHVVVGLMDRGKEIYCRINRKDGTAAVEKLTVPRWFFHPDPGAASVDVAVAAAHLNFDLLDQECIPLNGAP